MLPFPPRNVDLGARRTKEERPRFPMCKAHRISYMALKPFSIRLRIPAVA